MIFDEQHITNSVNKKLFPFALGGILVFLAVISMVIVYLKNENVEMIWMVGGTELLMYLLINAICSLVVRRFGTYLKKTILAYIINLVILLSFIFLLAGKSAFDYNDIFPIYSALVVCYFMSIVLAFIIRKVMEALRD
ncbi:MAG: hypothetical protein H7Y00_05805 [Fimbriimonadaceae bacterium]|nr:hypothetical protein [Chitinophagales bacterium]